MKHSAIQHLAGCVFICCFGTSQLSSQIDPSAWERVYPTPSGAWLRSVAWGNSGFVIVGQQREMLFSTTGEAWERIVHLPSQTSSYTDFANVSFAGGSYFVPAGGGWLIVSENGRDWSPVDIGTDFPLGFTFFSHGQFCVVAASGKTMMVSPDLVDWQSRAIPSDFRSLVEVNGEILALGSDSHLYVSSDLSDWTERIPPWAAFGYGPEITKVCHGSGRYVAVGGFYNGGSSAIYSSTDGVTWTASNIMGDFGGAVLQDCAHANGKFYAVGSYGLLGGSGTQYLLTSNDAVSWNVAVTSSSSPPGGALSGIAGNQSGKLVAVGFGGAILSSSDDITWTLAGSYPRDYLNSALFANDRFVVVGGRSSSIGGPLGGSVIFSSADGRTWNSFVPERLELLSSVAFGNGTWVVTGDDGGVFVSPDAVNWTDASIPIDTKDLRNVVFANGKFHAYSIYRDLVYTSTDGVSWTSFNAPGASSIDHVKHLAGKFLALGGGNAVAYSEDGVAWTSVPTSFTDGVACVNYGKGRWVAGGYMATGYSLDGTTWQTEPAPMSPRAIDYLNGRFVAACYGGGMMTSSDGTHWDVTSPPAVTDLDITSLTHGNGIAVCVGGLAIYRASFSPLIPWPSQPEFLFPEMIEFFGETGCDYRLLQSDDLSNWQIASEWLGGHGDFLVWSAPKTDAVRRFWKVEKR